jgi:hypothetical protein
MRGEPVPECQEILSRTWAADTSTPTMVAYNRPRTPLGPMRRNAVRVRVNVNPEECPPQSSKSVEVGGPTTASRAMRKQALP